MNKEIKTDLFLESYDSLDLFLDEIVVFFLSDFTLAKLGTSCTDLLRLL
jgi:hypothetical protein